MKLTDESWISYQQGKGNEEYQKYMYRLFFFFVFGH